jgi:hypothetical protein
MSIKAVLCSLPLLFFTTPAVKVFYTLLLAYTVDTKRMEALQFLQSALVVSLTPSTDPSFASPPSPFALPPFPLYLSSPSLHLPTLTSTAAPILLNVPSSTTVHW